MRLPTHYKILTEQANLTYDNKVQLFAKQCAGEKKTGERRQPKINFFSLRSRTTSQDFPLPTKIGNDVNTTMYVSISSIFINTILTILKLSAGVIGRSDAMITDALHSASDVFSTFIVIIGVLISGKKADRKHQYGHERLECVASIILAVILAFTGFGIGMNGIKKIEAGSYGMLEIPGMMALAAATLSIAVKEWMYWYTRAAAKKVNSGALMADAWHHRSDALSSAGAFAGILGSRCGYPILDPIASIIICIFIEKAAFDIFRDSVNKMIDRSCSSQKESKIRAVILEQSGVEQIDVLKTRLFGSKVYVDVEFSMTGKCSLIEAHKVAEAVHDAVERNFPEVKHCMVHVNPLPEIKN